MTVVVMPGVPVNAQVKQVDEGLVQALQDLLAQAQAGEVQAVAIAFAGYDSERIHGRAIAGNYMAHAGDLILQMNVSQQHLINKLV